jgi:7-keto-8-aminopelargonate synthetase-like enzyme
LDHLDAHPSRWSTSSSRRPLPRLICLDGVNSMTGNIPQLGEFARIAREHDALLYVDDAHGFGVVGERGPGELCGDGMRGNSVVRHSGRRVDDRSASEASGSLDCRRHLK